MAPSQNALQLSTPPLCAYELSLITNGPVKLRVHDTCGATVGLFVGAGVGGLLLGAGVGGLVVEVDLFWADMPQITTAAQPDINKMMINMTIDITSADMYS